MIVTVDGGRKKAGLRRIIKCFFKFVIIIMTRHHHACIMPVTYCVHCLG